MYLFCSMARPLIRETSITDLGTNYQFDWKLHDFLVSDEQHYLQMHDTPMHVDGYIVGICTQGKIRLEVNHKAYKGGANEMIITTPHQVIRVLQLSRDFRCRFIVFSKRFLSASFINPHILENFRFAEAGAVPVVTLNDTAMKQLLAQFIYIWKRFRETNHPYRREITGNLLMVLLHDFESRYRRQFQLLQTKRTRKEELNRQFQELVFRHFRQEHGVSFYAARLHITPKHLTETVKAVTGRTAGDWISESLLLEAQGLLQQPENTIQQIAALLHFPDQSSFGKFFRKHCGVAPSRFVQNKPGEMV